MSLFRTTQSRITRLGNTKRSDHEPDSGVHLGRDIGRCRCWCITYITIESTSLRGALRAGLISEAIGNIPYLFAVPAVSPPGIAMSLLAAFVFIRVILRVGELTPLKAGYGVGMTYFVLLAIVSCA